MEYRKIQNSHGCLYAVIPREYAERFGIKAGDTVRFDAMETGIFVRKVEDNDDQIV